MVYVHHRPAHDAARASVTVVGATFRSFVRFSSETCPASKRASPRGRTVRCDDDGGGQRGEGQVRGAEAVAAQHVHVREAPGEPLVEPPVERVDRAALARGRGEETLAGGRPLVDPLEDQRGLAEHTARRPGAGPGRGAPPGRNPPRSSAQRVFSQ